jgi:hypothetical protein
MTDNPKMLGCEHEIRKYVEGKSFVRPCGELAVMHEVRREDCNIVGRQKLCGKHVELLRKKHFVVTKVNSTNV